MDIAQLKNKVIDNPTYIEEILEAIGCGKIKSYTKEIRCAIDEVSNPTGVTIKKETLSMRYRSDSKDLNGDIITLIQYKKGCNFPEAVKIICDIVGEQYNTTKTEIKLPFGGYFKSINAITSPEHIELQVYDESILNEYINKPNRRFLKDNISIDTQREFNVMYDLVTDRIVVPWRDSNGRIIGIMGRYNADSDECKKLDIAKWYPLVKFPKSQVLYGFSENYHEIQEKKTIFVGESEKLPMQLRSMGVNVGLAVGSHSISDVQANLIKSCFPERIILCFDEDVEEEYVREQCKLFTNSAFLHTKVGYVYDREKRILKQGSKMSPTDVGNLGMKELLKTSLYYI